MRLRQALNRLPGLRRLQRRIQTTRTKIEAIESYPRPEHSAGLRRFLGMLNYYRRCIPRAADLQAPLHDLLKGIPTKGKLSWTRESDIAFQRCKSCIAEATRTAFLSSTQFSFDKGEDNVVADALSRTCTISMLTLLDSATIKEAQ